MSQAVRTQELTPEQRKQTRMQAALKLGVVMLPMTIVLSSARYWEVTEDKVKQAFVDAMGDYGSMVTLFEYEVREESVYLVTRGIAFVGAGPTVDVTIVDVWYYFHLVPAGFS